MDGGEAQARRAAARDAATAPGNPVRSPQTSTRASGCVGHAAVPHADEQTRTARIEKEEKRPRGSRTPREVAVRPPQLPSDKRRGGRTGNRDRRPENESGVARWEGALGLQVRQAQTAVAPFPEARGAARGPPGGGCFSTSGQTSEMSEKAWSLTCARRGHPRAPGAGEECANSGSCPPSPETSPGSPCLWDPFPIDEGNYNPHRMRRLEGALVYF